jgi:alpha-aminoadipic semialdehyde synthase
MLRGNRVIGILRESKNKWEQRAPLAPKHVERLVKQGVRVIVQPSTRRAFYDAEYARAGAVLQEDVSPASLIMGVKEVPIPDLLPERSYLFFSHTIKAQP